MTTTLINLDPTVGMTEAQLAELNAAMEGNEQANAAREAAETALTEALDDAFWGFRNTLAELRLASNAVPATVAHNLVRQAWQELVNNIDLSALTAATSLHAEMRRDHDAASQRFLQALACKRA